MLKINYLATIGVKIPASSTVASLNLGLFGTYVGVGTTGIATLGVVLHPDARPLDSICCVGGGAKGVATLSVGLPRSCRMASRGSSSLCSESGVGVGTLGVVLSVSSVSRCTSSIQRTFSVGVPASKRSASVCQYRVAWHPEDHFCFI
jgi:hypothetical protein